MEPALTDDPDLHLLAGTTRVAPVRQDESHVFRFVLPAGEVRLVSRADRPREIGAGADPRLLGFALTRLRVDQGETSRALCPSAEDLLEGFHDAEPGPLRWTTGHGVLPARLFAGLSGRVVLRVGGFGLPAYRRRDGADSALFHRFESLGEDCEFGIVQRHHDAEPVSLLRWAGTDLDRLIAGLECGFAGLGDPAHLTLDWLEEAGEYRLRDPRYLTAHTWLTGRLAGPAAEAEALASGAARLGLLRRKLMADLAAARRIFVFKSKDLGVEIAVFHRLHAVLRRIGPVRLLCVRLAETPAQVGQVERIGEGLYLGHIDRFIVSGGSHHVWHALCATTAAMAAEVASGQQADM